MATLHSSVTRVRTRSSRLIALFSSLLILPALACNMLAPAPAGTPVVVTVLVPAPTQTFEPELPPTLGSTSVVPSPTSGPACTVQQNVNLRSGPGTAYDPPLDTLETGTELIPVGYNAEGVPGGSWVQVQVKGHAEKGWVNAASQYVSCTMELASLPSVSVPPPPKPQRPVVSAGTPDGDNQDNFRISLDFNPDYLLRVYVFYSEDPNENFKAKKDGRDIQSVQFQLSSADGSTSYVDRQENNSGYCIFGGGEPNCNTWTVDGGQYKWPDNGKPLKPGEYTLTVTVTGTSSSGDSVVGVWFWDANNPLKIDVP